MAILSEDFCAVDGADLRAEVESVAGVGFGRSTTGGLAMYLRALGAYTHCTFEHLYSLSMYRTLPPLAKDKEQTVAAGTSVDSFALWNRQPLQRPIRQLDCRLFLHAYDPDSIVLKNDRDFNVVNVHTMHDAWTVSSFLSHPRHIQSPSISRTRWRRGGGLEDLEDEEQDGDFNGELRPIAASHPPHDMHNVIFVILD
ncbi:hypothetical protein C8R42DRAFT_643062 [Lentinula raphanica]|nr:hypothetical protein C8R42DRAFT_643062 [Lentinula raphanica]